MAEIVIMPKQGLQMTEGIIISWLVAEGESVCEGDDLFEMETDKLTMSVPAAVGGTLLKILRHPGDTVPVAEPIAIIGAEGEDISEILREGAQAGVADTTAPGQPRLDSDNDSEIVSQSACHQPQDTETGSGRSGERVYITPRARAAAERFGINYAGIAGSGPDGLVVESDILDQLTAADLKALRPLLLDKQGGGDAAHEQNNVAHEQDDIALEGHSAAHEQRDAAREHCSVAHEQRDAAREHCSAAHEQRNAASERGETLVPLTGMREAIAARMKSSLNEMAQLYHRVTVDMSKAALMRDSLKSAGVKVSYNDIILWCTAKALTEYPVINSVWGGNGIVRKRYINLGIAVALDEGLIVPVIRDADRLTLQEIASRSAMLADKAKQNRLTHDECTGGTFTVTNLGMYDIDCFTAIINPPEAGILAVGKIAKQPAVENDEVVIRPLMQLTLTYDHRVVDGAPAALFLRRVKELLENPVLPLCIS